MTGEDDDARSDAAISWFVRLRDCDDEILWIAHRDWLEADPANPAAYARVEAAWVAIDDPGAERPARIAPSIDPVPALVDDLAERRAVRSRWRREWIWMPAAAAACIAGIVSWPLATRRWEVPETVYRTDGSHLLDVTLADGSRITLNRDTTLTARIDGGVRTVALRSGEAAFDVRHDSARPFTVAAAGREVRVLGTAFGITARGGAFGVAVSRGTVSVSAADDSNAAVRLPAGKGLFRPRGAAKDEIADVSLDNVAPWRTGELSYAGATLAVVAQDYERLIGEPVVVDPGLRALPVSGIFHARDEAALAGQLEMLLPIRIVRSATGRRIVRSPSR